MRDTHTNMRPGWRAERLEGLDKCSSSPAQFPAHLNASPAKLVSRNSEDGMGELRHFKCLDILSCSMWRIAFCAQSSGTIDCSGWLCIWSQVPLFYSFPLCLSVCWAQRCLMIQVLRRRWKIIGRRRDLMELLVWPLGIMGFTAWCCCQRPVKI